MLRVSIVCFFLSCCELLLLHAASPRRGDRKRQQQHQDSRGTVGTVQLGAAVYLVSEHGFWGNRGRNCGLNSSLTSMEKYWAPNNPYPVILVIIHAVL